MKLAIIVILSFGFSSLAFANDLQGRKQEITKKEKSPASRESLQRKQRSEELLKKENVPINSSLPVVDDSNHAKHRTTEEIAHRAIALFIVGMKGDGAEQSIVEAVVKRYGAEKFFSPKESAFIKNEKPLDNERSEFAWRYEDYWVLLWSLGYVDKLDRTDAVCNLTKAGDFLRQRTTEQFIHDAKLRSLNDILDQTDLVYRYHWTLTEARLRHREAPSKLLIDVVMERHYVLNWLTGYMNEEWDDVATDT